MRTTIAAPAGFSFRRTVLSHGWCALPPFRFDRERFTLRRVLRLPSGRVIDVTLSESPSPSAARPLTRRAGGPRIAVETHAAELTREDRFDLVLQVRHMLRLDEDYSGFYLAAGVRPSFAWIPASGAGRLLRSPTVFEDLVKLICTTNCTWSLTEVMVRNLVGRLGAPVEEGSARAIAGARRVGSRRDGTGEAPDAPRAFPGAEDMASRPARFYESEIRAGYRASALAELARRVARGDLDVEGWRSSSATTSELSKEILSVRGAGPYTAENLLKLLGRYEGLAIDSWCRAKYVRLYGDAVARLARSSARRTKTPAARARKPSPRARAAVSASIVDASMTRRYSPFGPWRGLALWCDLTKDWLEDSARPGGERDKF